MRAHVIAVLALAFVSVGAFADTKVTLSDVHICCKSCADAIAAAVQPSGATATADKETKKVEIVAKDVATAQAAVDALSAAGFIGKSDNKDVVVKPAAVGDGKSKSLDLTTHNCCAKCTKAIDAAAKTAAGVTDVTATPKDPKITVKGDFEEKAAAKALNDAGFQVKK